MIGCILSLFVAACVTALLLMPETPGGALPFPHFDKAVHVVLFFMVGFPAMWGLQPRWHWHIWAVVVAYSGLIEVLQPSFGRSADGFDLVANALGAMIAVAAARWARSKTAKVQQRERAKA